MMGQTPDNHFESMYLRALGEQVSNNRNKASGPSTSLGTTPHTPSKQPSVLEWARTPLPETPSRSPLLTSQTSHSSISTKIPGLFFQKWVTEVAFVFYDFILTVV